MNNESIKLKLDKLNNDSTIQNYIAQANARYILLNTNEDKSNFPPYTINDDHLNLLAFQYLNLGCFYAENRSFTLAPTPLEKGASLLEVVHAPNANRKYTSNYYGLIAALSYYVAFEYSKAFILITKFEANTIIASLLRQFLQRNFTELINLLYPILLGVEYSDEEIANEENESNQKIYEVTIARALDGFVKFYLTGDKVLLENSKALLRNLKDIAYLEEDVAIWWVIRLLLLISEGFIESSVWSVLPHYFNIDDEKVKSYIYSLVYMRPRGNYELFISQRSSLQNVLSNGLGCVVSIPTSSGKTRIAELAILHSITTNSKGKILYIAPFRSLAFEIESSLEKVFETSGISVSHLYGGSLYSKLDEMSVNDSDVIIATPEKAKAILRANNDVINEISLVILDEGHLLGDSKRLIMNEIFYEELRLYIEENSARFLLLSAVLPNADELAEWLTGDSDAVFKNNWRPSEERLGILEWRNHNVSLNWESQDQERSSFNPRFVTARDVKKYKYKGEERTKFFPESKNDAIAATAYRLKNFGPLLIFVGVKESVFVMARAYLNVMENTNDHTWKRDENWRTYELACIETYGSENEWLTFARKGILCHNSALHSDVRLPLERLMREDKPLVIISTSTLGQGVNLGVSTVIFSTIYQAGQKLKARDFWNIAGRAGRAFVDHEGKILVALDTNNKSIRRRKFLYDDIRNSYFDKDNIDHAKSGILSLLIRLKKIADSTGTNFSLLLELIAENRIDTLGDEATEIDYELDYIDDTLLSLMLLKNPTGDIEFDWIDSFFGKSLSYIQSQESTEIKSRQLLKLLKARTKGVIYKVGSDRLRWISTVKSGIPLTSDLHLEDKINEIIAEVDTYLLIGDEDLDDKINLLNKIENIIKGLSVLNEKGNYMDYPKIDLIRNNWMKGIAASLILEIENGEDVITNVYSFSLPWVLNGIAKKMVSRNEENLAEVVEELAILVEAGLPSISRVKIYQAGIRSRSAANELGNFLNQSFIDKPLFAYKREFSKNVDSYIPYVSSTTKEWLELLRHNTLRALTKIKVVAPFTFGKTHLTTNILIAKKIDGRKYLLSPDLKFTYEGWGDIDFSTVSELQGISFIYNSSDEVWEMMNSNPYLEIYEE